MTLQLSVTERSALLLLARERNRMESSDVENGESVVYIFIFFCYVYVKFAMRCSMGHWLTVYYNVLAMTVNVCACSALPVVKELPSVNRSLWLFIIGVACLLDRQLTSDNVYSFRRDSVM